MNEPLFCDLPARPAETGQPDGPARLEEPYRVIDPSGVGRRHARPELWIGEALLLGGLFGLGLLWLLSLLVP